MRVARGRRCTGRGWSAGGPCQAAVSSTGCSCPSAITWARSAHPWQVSWQSWWQRPPRGQSRVVMAAVLVGVDVRGGDEADGGGQVPEDGKRGGVPGGPVDTGGGR